MLNYDRFIKATKDFIRTEIIILFNMLYQFIVVNEQFNVIHRQLKLLGKESK
jgi:hypothetical protein